MILGRVAGTVVATRKDERLEGFKLLVVRAVDPDGKPKDNFVIAVDTVDVGIGELVLVVSGSSARGELKSTSRRWRSPASRRSSSPAAASGLSAALANRATRRPARSRARGGEIASGS